MNFINFQILAFIVTQLERFGYTFSGSPDEVVGASDSDSSCSAVPVYKLRGIFRQYRNRIPELTYVRLGGHERIQLEVILILPTRQV
jgi:hypothetical protein